MELNGKLGSALHGGNQLGCPVRNQQSCHILDTDGICSHLFDLFRHIGPIFQRICIAQGIRKRNLRMSSTFLFLHSVGGIYCLLQIPQVVETVKNTNNINTVCNGLLHKCVHHVIRIWSVTQNILSAEQHLQFRIFKAVAQFAEPIPWIFLQETKGCVKSRTTPALHGVIAYLIHFLHNGKHKFGWHSGCNQRLMRITQYGFRNFYRFLCLF